MKFGHDFSQSLGNGEFPQEWIDSAISYKQLKKCIKKVQKELGSLGLDAKTLNELFIAAEGGESSIDGQPKKIIPMMVVALDPRTGVPKDAWLTEDTKQLLSRLSISKQRPLLLTEAKRDLLDLAMSPSPASLSPPSSNESEDDGNDRDVEESDVALQEVEMPLMSNSEFFRMLKEELGRLDNLQVAEQRKVEQEIAILGKEISSMVEAGNKKSQTDTQTWREIFRIYVESEIFFSTRELEHGSRTSDKATEQLHLFAAAVKTNGLVEKLTKEGHDAFDRFLQINFRLLQYLRFQELNQTALQKIMKKFDKRTALHAEAILPIQLAEKPFIAQSLARSAWSKISKDLVTIIPQLSDYLCPVCFNISYKPIRLKCDHVFCIRCLIVMQRANQDHCPLCRGSVVMEASSDNLDADLMAFLKTNFPREVKLKQKENEHAAAIDRYGADYDNAKCSVM